MMYMFSVSYKSQTLRSCCFRTLSTRQSICFILSPIMAPQVAIVIYSLYGHVASLAEGIQGGIESAGGKAEIFQIEETLTKEVLGKMKAKKPNYPEITPTDLAKFDGFLLGIPTRYGTMPAQWKTFWDRTGGLWKNGGFYGKFASIFTSTAGPGGGQESTALNTMSTLVHHGIIYVPLGYHHSFTQLAGLKEVHGGSPWGAGTFASDDGSRKPTDLEMEIAHIHGQTFWNNISRVKFE